VTVPHLEPQPFHPYTVTGVRPTSHLTNAGTFQDVVEVHFETPEGRYGMVRVPARAATPAHVDNMIQAHLDNLHGIHQLGVQPHPENAA